MNRLEDIFFALLRSAVWNKTSELEHIPTEQEWNDIYTISKEQTVTGIMLDAISKLHKTQRPPQKLLLQWIVAQKFIEKSNISMNKELKYIYNELSKENICTYLLKGQGVARLYPIPEHRVCGDIDLYFKEEELQKAITYFKSQGCSIEDEPGVSHVETNYKGIIIELHRKSSTFFTKRLQNRYNEICESIIKDKKYFAKIDGKEIEILPPLANALQMLSHMLRHILMSGLGLRQVCDWVLFINKYQEYINKEIFIAYMKELDLFNMYKAITAISTDYIGLPKSFALCDITPKDKIMAKKIMSHIMTYGNFGHYKENCITETKWDYMNAYFRKVKNSIHFYKLSRLEAWNYPIWQLRSIPKVMKK